MNPWDTVVAVHYKFTALAQWISSVNFCEGGLPSQDSVWMGDQINRFISPRGRGGHVGSDH